MMSDPIRGKAIQWTFEDGPVGTQTFEHVFGNDGGVTFRMLDESGKPKGEGTHVDKCEIATVGEDVYAVSYLSDSGYTLTVVLDYRSGNCVAFASNENELSVSQGTFEDVDIDLEAEEVSDRLRERRKVRADAPR